MSFFNFPADLIAQVPSFIFHFHSQLTWMKICKALHCSLLSIELFHTNKRKIHHQFQLWIWPSSLSHSEWKYTRIPKYSNIQQGVTDYTSKSWVEYYLLYLNLPVITENDKRVCTKREPTENFRNFCERFFDSSQKL